MKGKELRETDGFLAVVVSMLFVGVEIRQNNNLARGQARQALTEVSQEWLIPFSQDPDYFDLWMRAWVEEGDLTVREEDRATLMMISHMRRLENAFVQHRERLVDDSALTAYGVRDQPAFQSAQFRIFWQQARASYDVGFAEFFEQSVGMAGG